MDPMAVTPSGGGAGNIFSIASLMSFRCLGDDPAADAGDRGQQDVTRDDAIAPGHGYVHDYYRLQQQQQQQPYHDHFPVMHTGEETWRTRERKKNVLNGVNRSAE